MYALDASTGVILWSFASGGEARSGAAIVGPKVYWGSGYGGGHNNKLHNNKLYAFGLPAGSRPGHPAGHRKWAIIPGGRVRRK